MSPSAEDPKTDRPDEERVPPYAGRTEARGESGHGGDASVERQMAGERGGGAGQTTSPAVESPAREDETTASVPESPHGVGESTTRRAEDVKEDEGTERGRHEGPTEYPSERPTGYSDEDDDSPVP